MRADRRGQVAARAADLRAQEGAPAGRRASSSRSTAPRCAATPRCRRSSATCGRLHRRAPRRAAGCCARPTRACCSSTRSASSGLDEQAMLLRAIEDKTLLPGRLRPRGAAATSSSSPAPTATSPARVASGPLPRGPPRAHQPVDLPPARPARAPRGHRAQPRVRARARRRRSEAARVTHEPRGARALPRASRARRRRAGAATSATSARRCAAWRRCATAAASASPRSTTRSRACAASGAASGSADGRRRRSDGVLERLLDGARLPPLDRFDRVQLEEVLRVCRTARSLSEAGRVLFAASRAARATHERRRPPPQVPRPLRPHAAGDPGWVTSRAGEYTSQRSSIGAEVDVTIAALALQSRVLRGALPN